MTKQLRWEVRPEGSNWGDFGENDQCGRLNLLNAYCVKLGMKEVVEGRTFSLSLPMDYPQNFVKGRHPPIIKPPIRNGRPYYLYPLSTESPGATEIVNDDAATICLQFSTHWDGLCHVGYCFDTGTGTPEDIVFYNGYRGGTDIPGPDADGIVQARALGIEHMAKHGVQGRGVMLDLYAHYQDAYKPVGYDDLCRILEADKIEVGSGDLLCIHTGMGDAFMKSGGKPDTPKIRASFSALDGRDDRVLNWITDTGIAAIAADNHAVEFIPNLGPNPEAVQPFFPLHQHCIFKLGMHLGEFWYLTELAAWLRENKRNRFLLTAPPLPFRGVAGGPAAPVATV